MSRLPRSQEHLKTAFIAEAASAARFRAYAAHAEAEEKPALAEHWRELAGDKDRLAGALLVGPARPPTPRARCARPSPRSATRTTCSTRA